LFIGDRVIAGEQDEFSRIRQRSRTPERKTDPFRRKRVWPGKILVNLIAPSF
jgi:hypothetical protein